MRWLALTLLLNASLCRAAPLCPDPNLRQAKMGGNAITGAVVVADVVLRENSEGDRAEALRREIVELCMGQLARHKVPAAVRFVPSLTFSASGKLARRYA